MCACGAAKRTKEDWSSQSWAFYNREPPDVGPKCVVDSPPSDPLHWRTLPSSHSPSLPTSCLYRVYPLALFAMLWKRAARGSWGRGPKVRGVCRGKCLQAALGARPTYGHTRYRAFLNIRAMTSESVEY